MQNQDLDRFLTSLFGEIDGTIYVPVKRKGGAWIRNFFKWPEQKEEAAEYILETQSEADVYISPALWNRDPGEESLTREDFKGSQYIWTEFDGVLPKDLGGIPEPSLKVQTSGPENQHWYWRLGFFETNVGNLETLNKKVTYNLKADMSAWDFIQVLRPPCTKNHKPNKGQTSKLVKCSLNPVSIDSIVQLEDPPKSAFLSEEDYVDVPNMIEVLSKYEWTPNYEDSRDMIFGIKKAKDRSKAMFQVACDMLRMGAINLDILSALLKMAEITGKFKERADKKKVLLGLIANARLSTGIEEKSLSLDDELLSFVFDAITVSQDLKPIEFVVENLLTSNGITLLVAKPGVGKTRLTMQMALCLALGLPFLSFKINKPKRVMIFHNEMQRDEHEEFHGPMMSRYDEDQRQILRENYMPVFLPDGNKFFLKTEEDFRRFKRLLYLKEPDVVIIDTLGATAGEPTNYAEMTAFFHMLDRARAETGIGSILNHHTRKEVVGNPKTKSIDDVYGGRPVTQYPNTIIGMWREENAEKEKEQGELPTEFYPIKQRLRARFRALNLLSTEFSDFRVVQDSNETDIERLVNMDGDTPWVPEQSKKRPERKRREPDISNESIDLLEF